MSERDDNEMTMDPWPDVPPFTEVPIPASQIACDVVLSPDTIPGPAVSTAHSRFGSTTQIVRVRHRRRSRRADDDSATPHRLIVGVASDAGPSFAIA
jgi:hypothetical protein